jgi:thiol:disulfide interchange protein DsbD
MEEGWHSYWKHPGDSGEATTIDWSLPSGFQAGPIQWPFPQRVQFGSMTSYGYSDTVRLLTKITPPDTLTPGRTIQLHAAAEWLICADICLPAEAEVSQKVTVTADPPAPTPAAGAIADTREALPRSSDDWTVEASRSADSYTLAFTATGSHTPDLSGAYFFPDEGEVVDHAAPQSLSRQGNSYLLAVHASDYARAPADTLSGVVVPPEGTSWSDTGTQRALQVQVPVDSARTRLATAAPTGSSTSGLSLPWALLFAFVGGILLNLMPCVFPVLSVKILGVAEDADGGKTTIQRHGALFGAGVLVSMWVLAGILLILRAAGSQIGWGFQLQSPVFIALMTLLFFGIGLNLLGAFEVGTRLMSWGGQMQSASPSTGNLGAFLTGVLATVVATPCTAPFMGAALGVALTLSPIGALLIFTALGMGMALPYVALSTFPQWLDALPAPGAWMETLKQFFAFPMFATAIWLVWVFGQQAGQGGVALLLSGLLLLGMAAWVGHRWRPPQLSTRGAWLTRTLVTAMVIGAIGTGVIGAGDKTPTSPSPPAEAESTDGPGNWASYSTTNVDSLRSGGQPVFVDFTAAWCLTCQVNKKSVLTTESVQQAFRDRGVALVRADWTNRNPKITAALRSHGRSGVPLYVLYPGDGSGPTLLPEVLTQDIVLNALEKVPSSS